MANYYRILSAYGGNGENLSIPIPWDIDSIGDLVVIVVGDSGKARKIDYWDWNSQLGQIEVPNSQNFKVWGAYVSRKEDAAELFQLIESHEVNAQNILEQFKKISRILESLQENEKTSLSSPDYMGGLLPNASRRAKKFVSFDENGNPACDIPTETFDDAVGFMKKVVGEAEEAFEEIVGAKTSEFNSNAASKKSEIDALVDEAEASKAAAAESAGAAAQSATSAAQAANMANYARDGAQVAALSAQASKESVEQTITTAVAQATQAAASSAQAAAQSAGDAASAKDAAEAAAQLAQGTDAGKMLLTKLDAGQLWFDKGKLFSASWANVPVNLPLSLCIEYDVDTWEGLGTGMNALVFISSRGVIWSDPVQLSGFTLRYNDAAGRLEFNCNNPGAAVQSQLGFGAYFSRGLSGLPTGRHTIVFCASGEIADGAPASYGMYVDGQPIGVSSVYYHTLASADLTSSNGLAVGQKSNYASATVSGVDIPIRLSRARIFNFALDAADAPYTVADYAAGRAVPPALLNPSAEQRALLALEDYTIAVGATRYVPDISGNAYDATVVESGGSGGSAWEGTVKGSRDTAIKRLCDLINANNQSA